MTVAMPAPARAATGPRPLRVAQIIDNLQWGGAQKMQLVLAEALGPAAEVTIFTLDGEADPGVSAALERLQVRMRVAPLRRLADPVGLARLAAALRRGRFDLAHTHLTYANIVGVWASRLAGLPVIASLRSAGYDLPPHKRSIAAVEAWTLRRAATRIMANGTAVAAFHQPQLGARVIDVLPNAAPPNAGLPPAERAALRRQLAGDAARPLIFAVGRLTPAKGYPDLLAAVAQLRPAHPAVQVVIVGEGELRADLEAQIAALGLSGQVTLLGRRDDVPRLLAAGDLFVSASHWEGFPNALLEALAAGLPVVATAVGEVPQLVGPDVGVVVPAERPDQLAAALAGLLADPARRAAMRAAGPARVARDYGLSVWRDRLLTLYGAASPALARRMETTA